ncbi:MAG: HAMP domain-containing histidine kinase [Paludibacteraceae bacterium]|nr:HAMP domain-containing histidine kinase [Paludibacteraceae bacterium]MBP6284256.1 HAMP domain-containing histidine kinase [Paludibacteraceae bacterium]
MNKRSIILLSVFMAITFIGLLFLQINYLQSLLNMRVQHFNEGAKRSLYQLSKTLEEEETLHYFNEALNQRSKQGSSLIDQNLAPKDANAIYVSEKLQANPTGIQQQITITSTTSSARTLQEISEALQNKLKQNFAQKKILLDDIAMRWLKESTEKPIAQRIDFAHMEYHLKRELENNGITTPFKVVLIDYTGEEVYRSAQFDVPNMEQYHSQLLFPNDFNPKLNILRVYFPHAKEYLTQPISFMIFSSVFFTIILLLVFLATIILIFRQKRLGEMKTDFMNNMTHEFKTPISSISLAAQMLKDEGITKTPEILKSISNIIYDETKRLSFQVEKVLEISILEKEKSIMKFKEASIHEIIETVCNNFSIKIMSKGGIINTNLQATDDWAMLDEMHFTNVIYNLLDNALKYRNLDQSPTLKINTWNTKDSIIISIEDNGIGIKKEHLKKIFEKFHRIHTGNVHNVKGFGLGLAYVKKIVEKHKGSIHPESELNKGTKFIITIPTLKKIQYD